jgi:hypothetical protein
LALASTPALAQGVAGAQPSSSKSSYQLIDEGLAAKRINEETAYKYRVFAAFADSRLPDAYRGDDAGLEVSPTSILDAQRRLTTFSPATQAELKPFFLRPASPGSWLTLSTVKQEQPGAQPGGDASEDDSESERADWYTATAVGGKVKVWAQTRYAGDAAKADAIAQAMTAKIWPDLVGLFKWEPLDDATLDDNGGGPALDIYLVRPDFSDRAAARNLAKYQRTSWRAIAMFAEPVHTCGKSTHYILVDSRLPLGGDRSKGLLQDVAHEFAHAVTGTQPLLNDDCAEYTWIREATGKWAEHFVYPNAQSEQDMARYFMEDPRTPLDSMTRDEGERHHYGAYLFPLDLMFNGRLQTIPKMWAQFATKKSLAGIDAALGAAGKDLMKTFPEFAVDNWNRATANTYDRIDQLKTAARAQPDSFDVSLRGSEAYEKKMFMGMHYLATKYVLFRFDRTVKSVTFENTLTGMPYAGVWTIEKIKGSWQKPVDRTDSTGKTWCRDLPTEDLEEFVIVFTNKQWKDKNLRVDVPTSLQPVVRAYPTGCAAWEGTITTTTTVDYTDQRSTITEIVRATMRFIVDTTKDNPGSQHEYWKVVSGRLSWQDDVTGVCSGHMQGSRAIEDRGPGLEEAAFRIWAEGGKMFVNGVEGSWPSGVPLPTYAIKCPNHPDATFTLLSGGVGVAPQLALRVELAPDGKSFGGDELWEMTPQIKKRIKYTFHVAP